MLSALYTFLYLVWVVGTGSLLFLSLPPLSLTLSSSLSRSLSSLKSTKRLHDIHASDSSDSNHSNGSGSGSGSGNDKPMANLKSDSNDATTSENNNNAQAQESQQLNNNLKANDQTVPVPVPVSAPGSVSDQQIHQIQTGNTNKKSHTIIQTLTLLKTSLLLLSTLITEFPISLLLSKLLALRFFALKGVFTSFTHLTIPVPPPSPSTTVDQAPHASNSNWSDYIYWIDIGLILLTWALTLQVHFSKVVVEDQTGVFKRNESTAAPSFFRFVRYFFSLPLYLALSLSLLALYISFSGSYISDTQKTSALSNFHSSINTHR
jgi:hypothetical protein